MIAVGTVAAVVLGGVLGVGAVVVFNWYGNLQQENVDDRLGNRPQSRGGTALNILLIGSDSRAGGNAEYGGAVEGQRADVTLLLHLSADRSRATVVSIPRDSMVRIPSCITESGTETSAQTGMFNTAFALGGSACTIRTVEQNTGVYINHHVVVDFEGFKQMVDALGTVDICVPRSVDDSKSGLSLSAGRHSVDGETALAYVRNRTLDSSGDLGRVKRQQAFLAAMVQKATSAGVLANPYRLNKFVNAATRSLTTDDKLGPKQMVSLANSVRGIGLNNIQFLTVPNEPYPADPNRIQWTADADLVWEALRTDTPIQPAKPARHAAKSATGTAGVVTPPSQVRVRVLNGTPTKGLAGRVAADLEAQGFTIEEVGNATGNVTRSVVRHDPGYDESGRTLSRSVPGSTTKAVSGLGNVVELVVGTNYSRVVPVQVQTAPTPKPTAPPLEARPADADVCA